MSQRAPRRRILNLSNFIVLLIGCVLPIQLATAAVTGLPETAEIISVSPAKTAEPANRAVSLGDALTVTVRGLNSGVAKGKSFPYQNLVLFLNGHPLPDNKPVNVERVHASCFKIAAKDIEAAEEGVTTAALGLTAAIKSGKSAIAAAAKQKGSLAAMKVAEKEAEIDTKAAQKKIVNAKKAAQDAKLKLVACDVVKLFYTLVRGSANETTKTSWKKLLGAPNLTNFSQKDVEVRVGLVSGETISPESTEKKTIKFGVINPWLFLLAVLFFGAALFGFCKICIRSNIIRDPAAPELPDEEKAPYSLARTQMAWWFFLVLGAYLFIAV